MQEDPSSSGAHGDESILEVAEEIEENLPPPPPASNHMGDGNSEWSVTTKVDASKQYEVIVCDKQYQFPPDVCDAAYTYYKYNSAPSITEDMDKENCTLQGSQVDLFPELSVSRQ